LDKLLALDNENKKAFLEDFVRLRTKSCIVLAYYIKSSRSRKQTRSFSSHLISFFVTLDKLLALDNENKKAFLFCIVLAYS